MPVAYLNAVARYFADSFTAITQLTKYISSDLSQQITSQSFNQKWDALAESHSKLLATIASAAEPKADGTFGTGYLCQTLRKLVPNDTIWAIEAVTNTAFVADNIQATFPGSWINCGGGGLGWSGGGTLGIKLASEYENGPGKGKFVVQIVGDGTFLFSVPGSVYWISQRYKIPVLTIVLNNKGKLALSR
jgi:thiamine pyrophosphate-dependent acetolactate synthase large subunit-like protein